MTLNSDTAPRKYEENLAALPDPEFPDFRRPNIIKTRMLRIPNQYTLGLDGEFREYAFNEERAPENKAVWREKVFGCAAEAPIDLEIGTGNGVNFRTRCQAEPNRFLIGLELKFKPLIQTIRGMLRVGSTNGRVCRLHAFNIDTVFAEGELNHIFMHFPDPWTTPRKPKNRMVNERMVKLFFKMQRSGSVFELKTDSEEYFRWAVEHFKNSPYELLHLSENWHQDPASAGQVRTQFENIFARQGLPIWYALWKRP